MATKPTLPKESFIELLSSSTPIEINRMIEEKGKKTKGVPLIVMVKK